MKSGRSRWTALGAASTVIAGIAAWALWPDPAPRQREYLDATACLLTDEKGVAAEPAKSVWGAFEQASATSLVRAQRLEVNGPQTADNAAAYLASLTSSRCGAIIAVGPAQIEATAASAAKHPETRFFSVGSATTAPGVTALDPTSPDTLRTEVADLFTDLAENAS